MKGEGLTRYKSVHLWWAVLFIIIFLLSFKYPVGQKVSLAIAPILHVVQAPVRWAQDFSLWFDDSSVLQQELVALKDSAAEQAVLSQELTALRTENTQLKDLLMITKMDGFIWHAVRVISRSLEEKSKRLTLQADVANKDDVVISSVGLVGLVDNVGADYAVVRTILDASIAVPVTKENSKLAALVRGDGQHLLVDFVPNSKAPIVGDILITSGAGGVFPSGLPVAEVKQVNAVDGGVFVEVVAEPIASWQRDAWLAIAGRQQP